MGVLFIFVFVLIMTLAAFWPNDGLQDARESVERRGATAASAMITYHSAATRSCFTPALSCGVGMIPAGQVVGQLTPSYAAAAPTMADGRFVSFTDGFRIYTAYNGAGYGPGTATVKMRLAIDGLMKEMTPDVKSNVGFYDQASGYFRPIGNVYYLTADGSGSGTPGPGRPVALNPASVGIIVPNGAPMVSTRIRTGG